MKYRTYPQVANILAGDSFTNINCLALSNKNTPLLFAEWWHFDKSAKNIQYEKG
jgi:hypothetical protein